MYFLVFKSEDAAWWGKFAASCIRLRRLAASEHILTSVCSILLSGAVLSNKNSLSVPWSAMFWNS